MNVMELLNQTGTQHEVLEHRPTFTAQHMASEEHVSGMEVAKPVVVKADEDYYMCVLPACCKIDFDALKSQLGVGSLELADEKEMAKLFPDCSLGAEPPFGNLYDMPTVMDKTLEADAEILFQGGSHEQSIRISMADYKRLVNPNVLSFSYHVS